MARKRHARPTTGDNQPLSRGLCVDYYRSRRRARARKTIALSVLGAFFVVLVGASVAVAAFVSDVNTKITGSVDENLKTVLATQEPGKPFYMLLIGIDRSAKRESNPSYGTEDSGYRSDSIMLARIDPSEKKVTLVSIHRDTMVDMDEYGTQKINAAYAFGQETYTTDFISRFAGVPISHYAEVNMDGMAAIIDAVGGIDITLDMDVYDPEYTKLDLKAGPQHMDGKTAVKYCRCRHAYDALGDGDRYRAANQRQVISILVKKILSSDPATIATTVSTLASYVRTDLDVQSIVSLALQFVGMDFENDIYTGMEPTTAMYIDNLWYEICDTTAWRKMMQRVDQGLPPTEEGDTDPLESSDSADVDADAAALLSDGSTTDDDDYYSYSTYSYDDSYDYEETYDSGGSTYVEPTYVESDPEPAADSDPEPEPAVEPDPEPTVEPDPEPEPEPSYEDTGDDSGGSESGSEESGGDADEAADSSGESEGA